MATVRIDRNLSEVLRSAFAVPKVKHRSAIVDPHLATELIHANLNIFQKLPENHPFQLNYLSRPACEILVCSGLIK